jgi:hypothetical protein
VVTETGQPATSVLVSYVPDGGSATDAPTVTIGANGSTVGVTVTDIYPLGKLAATKVIDPNGGPAADGDQFTMHVDCPGATYDQDIVLTSPGSLGPLTTTNIPTGTQCTVTETAKPATATLVSYDPHGPGGVTDPPTLTVGENGSVVGVTITNSYPQVGGEVLVTLDVNKEIVGNTVPANGATFKVHVVCTGISANVDETLSFTYPGGLGVQSISRQIPSDEELSCTVTETDTGGETLVGYKIDGGAVEGAAPTIVLNLERSRAGVTVVNDPTVEVEGAVVLGQLPFTGGSVGWTVPAGLLLLLVGGALLLITRRREQGSAA